MISCFLNNSWEPLCENRDTMLQKVVDSELPVRSWPLLIGNELTADFCWLTEDGTREMGGEGNPVDHVRHLSASAENQTDLSELEAWTAGFGQQSPCAEKSPLGEKVISNIMLWASSDVTWDFLRFAELAVLLIELDLKIKKSFCFFTSYEEFMDKILP